MLYFEPRGLSCGLCHGSTGRRSDVIRYVKYWPKNKYPKSEKNVTIEPIYKLSFKKFRKGVLSRKNLFMPIYKFSDMELRSIYFYLQKVNGRIKKPKTKKR